MDSEPSRGKFFQKVEENPAVPIGLIGLTGVLIYGIYNFRHRKIKTSLYLIHLRVAAQSAVLGCMTLGLVYSLATTHLSKYFPFKKTE